MPLPSPHRENRQKRQTNVTNADKGIPNFGRNGKVKRVQTEKAAKTARSTASADHASVHALPTRGKNGNAQLPKREMRQEWQAPAQRISRFRQKRQSSL